MKRATSSMENPFNPREHERRMLQQRPMSFKDHERIMFAAQRAEARGEFKDMLTEGGESLDQAVGQKATEGTVSYEVKEDKK